MLATHGTAGHLASQGVAVTHVDKVGEGPYDPVRLIELGRDRPGDQHPGRIALPGDAALIRAAATRHDVPCVTTVRGGRLLVESLRCGDEAVQVVSLQHHHRSAAEVATG